VAQISPVRWSRWSPWGYLLGILLLIGVAIAGVGAKGAQRWLDIGGFRFQPSEIMKLAVPMTVAWYLGSGSAAATRYIAAAC
jgi:rod shape determining protein RodA